jgi:hypothetical protein
MRNGVYPTETKIEDVFKVNMMTADILLEENDRVVICGSANMLDHEKNTLAHMVQMTPAIVKKMTTIFQVTFLNHHLLSIIHGTATFLNVVQHV